MMRTIAAATLGLCLAVGVAAQAPKSIKVTLNDAQGKAVGTATLKTVKTGVELKLSLTGLTPGDHGVHIHQKPTCTAPDFKSAGAHFNPDGKMHGFQNAMGHHNGDLPKSVTVAANGKGTATFVLTSISLDPAATNSVFLDGGTSIVVHAKADDEMTDPSGNSGDRIACGVIQR